MTQLNLQMIARELHQQPGFASFGYALLGVAEGNCGPLQDFLPDALGATATQSLARFQQASATDREREYALVRLRALPGTATLQAPGAGAFRSFEMNAVRFLTEAGLAAPTRSWGLTLEKGPIELTDQGDASSALSTALRAVLGGDDARIAELAAARNFSSDDRYCGYLRARSRAALASLPELAAERLGLEGKSVTPAVPALQSTLQHCATCHGDGTAPPLPFIVPEMLASLLHQHAGAHGDLLDEILFRISPQAGAARMPPDTILAPAQRDALGGYVQELGRQSGDGDELPRH